MAAIAPIGTPGTPVASVNNVANPTTLTPDTGSGYAVGDLLLCFTACRSATPTVATPSGWTSLLNVTGTNGRLVLFGKVAASTSEAAPSVVWSGTTTGTSGTPVAAVVAAFDGSGISDMLADVTGTVANGAASTATSAGGTGITTLQDNDLVISLTTRLDDAFTAFTAPAGFTNITAAFGTTSGADFAIGWAYQVKATAGVITAPNFGLTGASSFASSGVLIALKGAKPVASSDSGTSSEGQTATAATAKSSSDSGTSTEGQTKTEPEIGVGFQSIGDTQVAVFLDESDVTLFTLAADQVSTVARVYCSNPDSVNIGFRVVVYADTGSLAPGTLIARTDEVVLAAGAAAAWRDFTFPSSVSLTAGDLWIGIHGLSESGAHSSSAKVYGNATGGVMRWSSDNYADGTNATWVAGGSDTVQFSIFIPAGASSTPKSSSDTGSGAEGSSTLAATTTSSDANGTVTEANASTAAIPASDANSGTTETQTVRVPIAASDANGATTETQTITVPVASSDVNGTVIESASANAAVAGADTNGTVTEAAALRLATSDGNGTTTETAAPMVPVSTSDTNGTTTEIAALRLAASDTNGATTEGTTPNAVMTSSDSNGSTTESTSLGFLASDSGTSTEAASFSQTLSTSDAGTSSEATSQTATLAGSDTNGTTTEASSTATFKNTSDTNGATTEAMSLVARPLGADTGTSTEAGTPNAVLTSADTATSTENASKAVSAVSSDTGTSTEGQALVARPAASESATGTEGQSLVARPLASDTGTSTEGASTQVFWTSADSGSLTEAAFVDLSVFTSDGSGATSEIATTIALVSTADFATSIEDQIVGRAGGVEFIDPGMIQGTTMESAKITAAGADTSELRTTGSDIPTITNAR